MKKKLRKEFLLLLLVLLIIIFTGCGTQEKNNTTDEPKQDQEVDVEKQTTCEHQYVDGVCAKCQYKCPHTSYCDDICDECGISIQEVCEHISYTKGECDVCGYKCPHITAHGGICDECKMNIQNNCKHTYENGVCTHCENVCKHNVIVKGYCHICGTDYRPLCDHEFVNGVCDVCTYECTHGDTKCGEICKICKSKAGHRFEGGVCTMCGFISKMVTDAIPEQYLKSCPQKGKVEKVVFTSYDYAKQIPYENTFFVYLPYGYDKTSDKEYNVLYLLHGSGENAAYWLAQLSYAGGYTETTKVVLDNLHYYNVCEDTIVVTPTENLNGTGNFYKELVNNIMPQAESRYKTKAHLYGVDVATIKPEDFIASRDYRAYAGLSLGSMIGWSIMAHDLPYFSYYGYYSGGTWNSFCRNYLLTIKNVLNDPNNPYDIKFSFHSCGDNDSMYNNHLSDYKEVIKDGNGKLVEDVNTMFLVKPGFAHRYNAWIIDLYNSLGYCFFKYND